MALRIQITNLNFADGQLRANLPNLMLTKSCPLLWCTTHRFQMRPRRTCTPPITSHRVLSWCQWLPTNADVVRRQLSIRHTWRRPIHVQSYLAIVNGVRVYSEILDRTGHRRASTLCACKIVVWRRVWNCSGVPYHIRLQWIQTQLRQ